MSKPIRERGALREAFEAGYELALKGVWYADAVTEFEPSMFDAWLADIDTNEEKR